MKDILTTITTYIGTLLKLYNSHSPYIFNKSGALKFPKLG